MKCDFVVQFFFHYAFNSGTPEISHDLFVQDKTYHCSLMLQAYSTEEKTNASQKAVSENREMSLLSLNGSHVSMSKFDQTQFAVQRHVLQS